MVWIIDKSLNRFQKFCINVLKCGPIPQHLAIIMDGNRRFAKKQHVEKFEGHSKGFDKLSECLSWCLELGIKEVTVYAFSIENFKRSQEEVDQLMNLAREKFTKLFEEEKQLMENGVCIRIIGNLSLLPDDLKKLISKAMILTRNNSKAILNVAFSYTSTDEINYSVKTIINGVEDGSLTPADINEDLISCCLYTNLSPNPELLIRTSGEIRLSDFLLWQTSSETYIQFTNVLWPEFGFWHLLGCIFKYQRWYTEDKVVHHNNERKDFIEKLPRVRQFLDKLEFEKWHQLELYANL